MPLVQAKCENCGGILEVDAVKRAAICPYCGAPYVVQDAINNYITNIERLHVDMLNVNSDGSAKARLEAAEAFMKLHKYHDARKAFADVCALMPQDYRGWWGQIRAISRDFSEKIENKSMLNELYSLYQSALVFAPEQKNEEIKIQFNRYYQPLQSQNTESCIKLKQEIAQLQGETAQLDSAISKLKEIPYPDFFRSFSRSALSGVVSFILVAGIIAAWIMKDAHVFFVAAIPYGVGCVWNLVLRPLYNSAANFRWERSRKKLKKLQARRNKTETKLLEAQKALDRLSR